MEWLEEERPEGGGERGRIECYDFPGNGLLEGKRRFLKHEIK